MGRNPMRKADSGNHAWQKKAHRNLCGKRLNGHSCFKLPLFHEYRSPEPGGRHWLEQYRILPILQSATDHLRNPHPGNRNYSGGCIGKAIAGQQAAATENLFACQADPAGIRLNIGWWIIGALHLWGYVYRGMDRIVQIEPGFLFCYFFVLKVL